MTPARSLARKATTGPHDQGTVLRKTGVSLEGPSNNLSVTVTAPRPSQMVVFELKPV